MPLFSIVVPVYNTAPYLRRCLDSVFRQTEGDFEVVAVDDGSTDESLSILRAYAARDARLIVLHQENAGLSEARNRAVAAAHGEYLAFVDSDDFIAPDFCAALKSVIEKGQNDLIVFDFDYVFDDRPALPARALRLDAPSPEKAMLVSAPMAPLRCVRRDLAVACPFPAGKLYEDLATTPLWLLSAERPAYLTKNLYHYYQRTGSIMHAAAFSPRFLDIYDALERVYDAFFAAGKEKAFRLELEYLFVEHLLRSAALRFASSEGGKEAFGRLAGYVRDRFPAYRKNPYVKQSSRAFRLIVYLASHKAYRAVRFLQQRRAK